MNAVNEQVRIIHYEPGYQPHFERLNRHWIEKYFIMEPVDFEVLGNPDQHIIGKGGRIIFAAVGDHIAGTVALKKIDDETIEMTKMGVDEAYQGRGLGRALAEEILKIAREMGYPRVVLYSNTKLAPAINMYGSLGFREVPVEPDRYVRSTIKMEIVFDEQNPHYAVATALESTVNAALAQLQQLPETVAANRPARYKWSAKEIIGHLIDSAINNNTRFVRSQQTPFVEMPGYEQDFWVKAQAWQLTGWQELLQLWAGFNRHLALTIRAIPPAALQHTCRIGDHEPVTLLFLVTDYLDHLQHHLKQTGIAVDVR